MKRYISSILIIVVSILSIGTYYAQVTSYASNLPELTFKTVEGDERELHSIILNGYYEEGNLSESFSVDSGKTTYQKERSFFERLDGHINPTFERLEKEYRSFMRGKQYFDTYYEDEDNLTFVTTKMNEDNSKFYPKFYIDSLEKKDKEVKSFEIDLPDQDKYDDIVIRDVQFAQSKLQIITQNDLMKNEGKVEIHHYTIDLAGKKVVNDETILSETFDSSNQGHFAMPSKVDGKPNNVFVIALVKGSYSEEGEFTEKVGASSLFSYHYDKKTLEKIKLPKDLAITYENMESYFSYDEENLYMTGLEEERSRIFTFDLEKQKLINEFNLNAVDFAEIKDGRIFVMTADELLIADALTGKTLYKAKLGLESDDQKKDKNPIIQLYDVYIK
ncbi:hypothetical protein [Peribacillus sp. NPDC097295]|uniref:hypothetical protein n=1 Tax=Peribacillus sp. NPDC097295 TaxID=3364402 RepID=UPI0038083A10